MRKELCACGRAVCDQRDKHESMAEERDAERYIANAAGRRIANAPDVTRAGSMSR
jgi:hypothetical protein